MTGVQVLTPLPVLDGEQKDVAARLLREVATTPLTTPAAHALFRYRWAPWLLGRSAGPVVPLPA